MRNYMKTQMYITEWMNMHIMNKIMMMNLKEEEMMRGSASGEWMKKWERKKEYKKEKEDNRRMK